MNDKEKAIELKKIFGKNKAIICVKEIIDTMEEAKTYYPQILPFLEYWIGVLEKLKKQ
jgi:hypothetical protein